MKISLVFLALISVGCVTRGTVDFSKYETYLNTIPGGDKFQDISIVRAESSGWLADCQDLINQAMNSLQEQTKKLGGEVTYNVRFRGSRDRNDFTSLEPQCKKNFFGLRRSQVMGVAAKANSIMEVQASDRAKKCSDKGGSWVNDSCQIKID